VTLPEAPVGATLDDQRIVAGLRAGDEAVFAELIDRYHQSLVRVAMRYVPSRAIAEEVVQDTWIGVIEGIDRFEGRSSVKTWLYRILMYRAKARGERERRSTPMSSLVADDDDSPAVPADRFEPAGSEWAGHWVDKPRRWEGEAEARLLAGETTSVIEAAIERLPTMQRDVIVLRDVSQFSASEVCDLLDVTEANQRVLLHRARSKVRAALEEYLDG
jgi:RNA polymerase sigma-70 factor (ECF subfamily)